MRSIFEASSSHNREFDDYGGGDSPTEPMISIILTPHPNLNHTADVERPAEQVALVHPVHTVPPRHSVVPMMVALAFVVVQVVLLARVVLLLFGADSTIPWIAGLYVLSGGFAWPFKLLVERLPFPAQIGPEIVLYASPLLAILVYGFIARVLVRFLKAMLNSR